MIKTTAIVVIGYNRPDSLKRLLKSVSKAHYPNNDIPIIISIDYSISGDTVLKVANDFNWQYGSKEIIQHKKNLGLKNHVLSCGDLTTIYGSIIMLEDDLYVSPNFYSYAIDALKFSANEPQIAGISLYNHPVNVHTNEVFNAIEDGFDNYYFQFASSWGQAWSLNQWKEFKNWYLNNQVLVPTMNIPKNVTDWSEKSWLKFYTTYLIQSNKYFLYPKISLSTNFSDAGTHVNSDSTSYQAALCYSQSKIYNFSSIENSQSIYDSFYENRNLFKPLEIKYSDLCIDLYGYKPQPKERYWLSSQLKDYEIVKSFTRSLKPLDANIVEKLPGKDFYLYDTSKQKTNPNKPNQYRRITYNIRHLSVKNSYIVTMKLLALKIKSKFGL